MQDIARLPSGPIAAIVQPTFAAYLPLQQARRSDIETSPPTEYSYGPHERQKLDVYLPPPSSKAERKSEIENGKLPCLVFIYGGGFVQGAKRIPFSQGTVYNNVGAYFSQRGYVTVLPDYRLYGQHDAKYPSGGEDVGLALDWIHRNLDYVDKDKIFVIGNSVGGVHVSTYLYAPEIPALVTRRPVRGAILAQVPFHFQNSAHVAPARVDVLDGYYGPGQEKELCPMSLRTKSKDNTDIAILLAENDAAEEIVKPTQDFLDMFPLEGLSDPASLPVIMGHNHISPFLSLGLGAQEDAWTASMLQWIAARC